MKVSKRRLKKEFRALQEMNDGYSGFIGKLSEEYDLNEDEKKMIANMQDYFSHTKKLFVNMENQCG